MVAGIWGWVERGFKHFLEHEFVRWLVELLGIIGVWLVLALAVILVVGLIVWLVAVLASWWWDRQPDAAKDLPQRKLREYVLASVFWLAAIVAILFLVGW
jgi:hypothetical protein